MIITRVIIIVFDNKVFYSCDRDAIVFALRSPFSKFFDGVEIGETLNTFRDGKFAGRVW